MRHALALPWVLFQLATWGVVGVACTSPTNSALHNHKDPQQVAQFVLQQRTCGEQRTANCSWALGGVTGFRHQTITHEHTTRVPHRRLVYTLDPRGYPVQVPMMVYEDRKEQRTLNERMSLSLSVSPTACQDPTNPPSTQQLSAVVECNLDDKCAVVSLTCPDSSASRTSAAGQRGLRVASVNLWNFNHWTDRQHLLQNQLVALDADVIGFQEVRIRRSSDIPNRKSSFQVADLADLLGQHGYQYVSDTAMSFGEGPPGQSELHSEGLAIFSRFPITKWNALQLTRDPRDPSDFHQRICMHATVQTPWGVVHMLNTHQSLSPQARSRTLREIGEYSAQLPDGQPVVLVGDMNCQQQELSVLRDFGFVDAWHAVHSHGQGTTLEPPESYTFSSWAPHKRIDFVFSKDLVVSNCWVLGKQYELSSLPPVGGVHDTLGRLYPSDHFFVAADVLLDVAQAYEIT